MGEIKEVHEVKEGDRFADERAARRKEAIPFAKRILVEPTSSLENKLSPDRYSTFCRISKVFINVILEHGFSDWEQIMFSMQQWLDENEEEKILDGTKLLLKTLSDMLGINNVIENLEIIKLNEDEDKNKAEINGSIITAYNAILSCIEEDNKVSDEQYIVKMMNRILSNLDGVPENVKFSATDKKKEPEPIKKQASACFLEFKDYAELEAKLREIDKSKVKQLKLKCTGSKVCKNINLDGFENLKRLSIVNCSVILFEKDEIGNERYYCENLLDIDIKDSVIEDLTNIKSNKDGKCASIAVSDSKISIVDKKENLENFLKFSVENSINWNKGNEINYSSLKNFFNRGDSNISIGVCNRISDFLKMDIVNIIELLNSRGYKFSSEIEFLPYFLELKKVNSEFVPECSSYNIEENRWSLRLKDLNDNRYKKNLTESKVNVGIQINDISELDIEALEKIESIVGDDSRISICPEVNQINSVGSSYEFDVYKKCRTVVDNILKDVDELNEDRSNELDVFLQVYRKLGELISYDHEAVGKGKSNRGIEKPRNLIGGLLEKKCVCVGYAEILRNVLSCKKIECIVLSSDIGNLNSSEEGHAYNQVKIGGKWYYTDLTWDADNIKQGAELEHCLLSQKEFEKLGDGSREDSKAQTVYEAQESYDRQTIADTIKQQDERKKKLQARTNVGLQQLISRLSALGIDGYDDIKVNFEDKNSIKFEQQMLELGKKIGVINLDFDLQSLKLDNMGDFDRTTMLLSYANFIQAKSVTPNACKKQLISMYEKMGIKTSDLSQMMATKQNTKKQEVNKQQEGEAK